MLIPLREDDPEGQQRVALFRQGLKELGWTEGLLLPHGQRVRKQSDLSL
jgi:hypothetical protein